MRFFSGSLLQREFMWHFIAVGILTVLRKAAKTTDYGAFYYADFYSLLYVIPLGSQYFPQHPVVRHPHLLFPFYCERPSFTLIQNKMKNCLSQWPCTTEPNLLRYLIFVSKKLNSNMAAM